MNPRIEKLCLPRHRRDAIWKFWQPNAKLEKIYPPIYWKNLDYKSIHIKKTIKVKESKKLHNENLCLNACNYTTLIYKPTSEKQFNEKGFHIFVDFEHNGLEHATWKESIEDNHFLNDKIKKNDESSIIEFSWSNLNHKKQIFNDQYLKRQELIRYIKNHIQKDNLFELDKNSYPNQPISISRRPRDTLHIDFYPAACFQGSKTEATFKTFYHRKYLLPQHLREHTLKDLITIANNIQLDIDIIGHFVLHPNELSKHEIKMFELTSEFGDIYEGHIIRINKKKLVLLLASTYHSNIKLVQSHDFKNIINDSTNLDIGINSQSRIEQIVIDHVREYLQINNDYSIEQIRRIQIELEPLMNKDKRRVIVHLITNDEIIENLTFEITREQEPKLFDNEYEKNLYFLQGINEEKIIQSVEHKLKELFTKRFSFIHKEENHNSYLQLTLDIEYDTLNSIKKMLYAYANHQLTTYSREECMRIGIEYSFDDLLDKLDSNELQSIDDKQIQMIIDDIQIRLRLQIERRFKAETTAKILLIGPSMKKETKSIGKEVNILNHHREIFINQLDTHTSSSKMKDIQRNHGNVILHEEIDGGPKSFDRLPMSIDSLTILTRIQQRTRLNVEENNNTLVSFESEIHPLMTFKDQKQTTSYSEQNNIEKNSLSHLYEPFLYDENDNNSIKTLNTISINTKSFNTSADTKQQYFIELHQTNQDEQQRKKKRMSRSSVEYGKHKQKRKKHKPYKSTSNIYINNMNSKHLFFNKLFLLYQNKKSKTMTLMKNHNRKQKYIQLPNAINVNTITETSNITTKIYSNDDITTIKNSISHHDNLFIKSNEDLSSFDELKQSNLLKSFEDEQLKINNSLPTIKIITDSISLESVQDNIEGQDLLNTRDHNIGLDEKISKLNDKDESTEYQQFQDEGFQDKEDMNDDSSIEDSEMSYDTERYLRSLYGSLSSTMKQVYEMYQSKSSRLRLTLDLAHTFINFLHIRKDIAYEIASTIIDARQRLVPSKLTQKSSSSTNIDENFLSNIYINEENDNDDTSISSGIITAEDSDTIVNENSKTSRSISDSRTKYNLDKKKIFYLSNSQRIMNRIITYLSEVDWRVFNYLTKHFLQNGTMITSHALEFSSALLIDLIEDSVYQTYFHSKWCSDSYIHLNDKNEIKYIENILIEEFFKKSIYYLFNRLQLINSPLLENIALMHTLKKYMSTNLLQEFTSLECHAIPLGLNPCIWFSSNILIKTICSLTDDILKQMNHDYLSDYTKFEYVLVSYFRKIQIVHNLQEIIETNQHLMKSKLSPTISNSKYLLHVIDLNQAPKFFSHKAFKRFQFGEHSHINDDIEALKDLVLLDIERHNIKSMKGPYIPLNINDLVIHQQNRVLTPSPWILAQYHQRSNIQKLSADECNLQEASYRYDETTDSIKTDNLPPEVRDLLDNMIRKYGTIEGNLGISTTRDLYEGLSEDVAQLIENAIEAVQTFDRENNIGDRKLQSRKTVNDRLTEFFKYAGRHGVRLLDDVLKLAKLRSHDPKKYIPLAVNMLKDRLNATGTTGLRKQAVRFAYTLETLLIATNDEPALIAAMLKKKTNEKKSLVFSERSDQSLTTELDSLKQITEEVDKKIDTSLIESVATTTIPSRSFKMFTTDKYQQILPTIDEAVESTMSFSGTTDIDREHYFEAIMSNAIMSHDGLTVAHLVVLVIGHNQEPLKLTNTQIEQYVIHLPILYFL
ncbi:unnamed protein product [Rotaria sp. Silwood1]|nr:unnamed protein product [Rotaria sp. Silwood1]CAF4697469.1 unnamed protein product [Rotaria sp. Silwood1]